MNESVETAQSSVKAKRELALDYLVHGTSNTLGALVERASIFTYHEILPEDSTYLYRVNSSAFENHLSFISSVRRDSLTGIVPQITFDDGHRSNYENAFPILERFGLKATFFVLAGRVGTDAKYISWGRAREMDLAGHRVASHGWSHRMLTQCSLSELEHEIAQSKREIEDRLGVEVDSISAPGGRWDERVVDACGRAGYKHLFHSNPWAPDIHRRAVCLQGRHMVTGRMSSQHLQKLMQVGGVTRQYLRAKYATKESVRRILGDQFYHKIWCWMVNWNPAEGMELEVDKDAKSGVESKR